MAVAKLLKGQGRWRQVIAVTHNPLLASLADRHYVVSKLTGSEVQADEGEGSVVGGSPVATAEGGEGEGGKYERGSGEGLRSRSVLSEVRGVAREQEISRMATGGGVHSAAGIALARALLSQG